MNSTFTDYAAGEKRKSAQKDAVDIIVDVNPPTSNSVMPPFLTDTVRSPKTQELIDTLQNCQQLT